VRNPLAVGLRFPDQRRPPSAQLGCGSLVEAVVDLAGVDEVLAFAAAQIDAVLSGPSSAKSAMERRVLVAKY